MVDIKVKNSSGKCNTPESVTTVNSKAAVEKPVVRCRHGHLVGKEECKFCKIQHMIQHICFIIGFCLIIYVLILCLNGKNAPRWAKPFGAVCGVASGDPSLVVAVATASSAEQQAPVAAPAVPAVSCESNTMSTIRTELDAGHDNGK